MQIIDNIPVLGEHEANTLEQARLCALHADRFALMADGHLGYGVPIGGLETHGVLRLPAVARSNGSWWL